MTGKKQPLWLLWGLSLFVGSMRGSNEALRGQHPTPRDPNSSLCFASFSHSSLEKNVKDHRQSNYRCKHLQYMVVTLVAMSGCVGLLAAPCCSDSSNKQSHDGQHKGLLTSGAKAVHNGARGNKCLRYSFRLMQLSFSSLSPMLFK